MLILFLIVVNGIDKMKIEKKVDIIISSFLLYMKSRNTHYILFF